MALKDMIGALLGVSAYAPPESPLPGLDDERVERVRKQFGGQLGQLPTTRTRWYLADLEYAMVQANAGDISYAAQLYTAMKRDGFVAGLMSTSAGGLVRLPKRFSGGSRMVRALEGRDGVRSVFDEMFPPNELERYVEDIIALNVAVGELVPVEGRDYPVFVRLDPEFLRYRWNENRWYYASIAGLIPITPGDGRWVLHTGGRVAPWQAGLWYSLGRAWIHKEHALLHKANWEAKLANPARAAVSPSGATDGQKQGFLEGLIAWGVNTVFELPPGWDVKIIESNGVGYEAFDETIKWAEREMMVALAGQTVTVDGGTGFANADIHKSIRADLIKARADALAFTLNTQGLPLWTITFYGEDALPRSPSVEWDTKPPRDMAAEGQALLGVANAISALHTALQPYERDVDVAELARTYGLPLLPGKEGVAPNAANEEDDVDEEAEADPSSDLA